MGWGLGVGPQQSGAVTAKVPIGEGEAGLGSVFLRSLAPGSRGDPGREASERGSGTEPQHLLCRGGLS